MAEHGTAGLVSRGKWCDYCSCKSCQEGADEWAQHGRYECADGTHICSICFGVEPCGLNEPSGRDRRTSFFCDDHPFCKHKPKLAEHELMKLRQTKDG